MKTKLLKHINFKTIEVVNAQQMIELKGGHRQALVKYIYDRMNYYCPKVINVNC